MSDLIDRQAAIDEIMSLIEEPEDDFNEGARTSASVIYKLPSAQVERKHGRWLTETIHYKDEEQEFYFNETRCSCCGVEAKQGWWAFAFCPNCGARMDGEANE